MKQKIIVFILIIFLFPFYMLLTPIFAFSSATSSTYEGIDVSSWQGNIDYSQVKSSGIDIVYIKSSESYYVDSFFEQNYSNAKSAGLKIGFYHYLTATNVTDAISQARFFVSTICSKTVDCKLVMDFETFNGLNNYEINQISEAFLSEVQKLTNKEVAIYSDTYNASQTFNSSISNYPLWVAQYDVSEPSSNGTWSNWIGWQYTDQGTVNGIDSYVDKDIFSSDIFLSDTSAISSALYNDTYNNAKYTTISIPYGTTLSELAIEYNTTIEKLVQLNNIANPNIIYAGNTLVVPIANTLSNYTNTYIVKQGDTLYNISLKYNISISAIAQANNIKNINYIYVGQILQIPTNSHDTSHTLYIVKKGDNLWKISRMFGVSIAKIIMLNRISNPNLIYPGNILRI